MNNYAYLIKAKAKATEAKNLFCWFSAKSDSRAERRILDILEDAEINVGRGANHQLPIRTNWFIVDDLPEEGVLDDTWCDRYELGEDGLSWQKIAAPVPAEPEVSNEPVANPPISKNDEEDYSANEDALFNLAEMPFRTQLLAQYMADDRHVYHISIPHRDRLSVMEMDTENHAVQNLILAAENVPEIKKYDMPGLWKFTSAFKTVFPEEKRYELGKQVQFTKLWFETSHIDRGVLTKEWAAGNYISSISRTPSGANAGGGNKTDRNPELSHDFDSLDLEIALATLPMDFNIYDIPGGVYRRAKEIVQKKESPFKEWSSSLRATPGILDYSRAAIFALIREASSGLTPFPDRLRGYISASLTESEHSKPSEETLKAARHTPNKSWESEISRQLAADRGEFVEGISDPTDPKWVTEHLTETKQPGVANLGGGVFSIDGLMSSETTAQEKETTSDVQMEENFGNETETYNEISESETATETGAGNADIGSETTTLNIESGHHNDVEDLPADNIHVMVDLETMGNKQDAPIVAIGAVVFDPATGSIGESFYKVVSLESSVNWGAKMDPSTVIWWLKQSSEARSAIVNDDAIPLHDALLQFGEFIFENIPGGRKKAQVWGNGASFDNCILRSSFDFIAEEYPWEYWNDRDVRTIVELGKAIGIDPKKTIPFEGERHNALADAIHQARYVSAIWQRLIEGNRVLQKLTQN
ncbi:3'-5' exonuclease [Klebsiella aerogenes]|uniref:exonuclease n=1 Tax=Klebsiella aerogenes TaxID=548 RepID=UPI002A840E26|nr:3'-5' exoribonuclease [Klebsiella aerogenes]WPR97302.1 3'-5' exoribonuclease [Klebsiella aerogenes]WPS36585.1 3'-5' exoribonuclease [Klebsiella aerogenes]